MSNLHKQSAAWAQFGAFQSNPPTWWREDDVVEFHKIVTALEESFGVDLSPFRIPESQLRPKIVGAQRAPRSGRFPGRTQMSSTRYCDEKFAQRQVEGIALYFQNLQPPPGSQKVGF